MVAIGNYSCRLASSFAGWVGGRDQYGRGDGKDGVGEVGEQIALLLTQVAGGDWQGWE